MTHSSRRCAIRLHLPALLLAGLAGLEMKSPVAFGQGPQNIWSGQAQCVLSLQSASYTYQEIQTWTITSTPNSNAPTVYPATWSVAGQGQRQDTQGSQVTYAQWTTSVSPTAAPIMIFVNSAHQLIIKSYHAQLRVNAAVAGMRQVMVAGVAQPSSPISGAEVEWQFPRIEVEALQTAVDGTSSTPITSSVGPMQPPGLPGVANCAWHFVKGDTGWSNPATPITQPPAPSQSVSINPTASTPVPVTFPTFVSSAGGMQPSGTTGSAAVTSIPASSGTTPAASFAAPSGTSASSRCQATQRPRDPMMMGTLHAGKSISHLAKIMSAKDSHFFQVKLPAGVNLSILLAGMQSGNDFDLYVYGPEYSPINCSLTRGNVEESVQGRLGQSERSNLVIVEVRPVAWTAGSSTYVLKLDGIAGGTASP